MRNTHRYLSQFIKASAVVVLGLSVASCADMRYYWQSVSGHVALLQAAKPVDDWLSDAQTPEKLKARLLLTQQIRQFAVTELKLPDNASYKSYADLQRKSVVWNVVAAPIHSLKLKTWCFPIAGCVNYKGYFSQDAAQAQADLLQQQGWEVSVYGVPAYSTLGWSNWAGGDPLLNTFVSYPEGELARLVFHELAHQVVYVPDDTAFNESFATAVERLGSARWLARHGSAAVKLEHAIFDQRRQQFRALTRATRLRLVQIYNKSEPTDVLLTNKNATNNIAKDAIYREFRAQYEALKASWGANGEKFVGYDRWVKNANNAAFGALAAYDDWVPAFEALFEKHDSDWLKFYAAVKDLAKLSKEQRRQALMNIAPAA